jgi:hypothetical protein
MGNRDEAIAAANRTIAAANNVADAQPAASAEYVRLSQDLIASLH